MISVPSRTVVGALAAAASLSLVAACGTATDPGKDPTSASADPMARPGDGRITRLLGDGSGKPATGSSTAPSSVSAPTLLLTGGSDLLVLQSEGRALVRLTSAGKVSVPEPGGLDKARVYAGLPSGSGIVLAERALDAVQTSVLDPATGELTTAETGPKGSATAAGLLSVGDKTVLQWGDTWYDVAAAAAGTSPALTATEAPVAGAVASAQQQDGSALVLTATDLVTLDASLNETARVAWSLPQEVSEQVPTAATPDGAGGLYVTTALPTSSGAGDVGGAGGVLHVAADGKVTVLAHGRPDDQGAEDCGDADLAADDAHLSAPTSVVVWDDRLVVADSGCNSVVQLPLPAA